MRLRLAIAVLSAVTLLLSGCASTEDSSAVYTQLAPSSASPSAAGESVDVTVAVSADAAELLARRPELFSAIESDLPGIVAAGSYRGSHFTVVAEVLGAKETATGAELYVDGVFHWWTFIDGELEFPSGGELIGRMRFEPSGDRLKLVAWDRPLDGDLHLAGIRKLFPKPYADRAIQRLGNRAEQWRLGEVLGRRWANQHGDGQ